MPQPIKKIPVNPMNSFSKELTTLVEYITNEVVPLYGITEINSEVFVYFHGRVLYNTLQ